VPVFGIGGRIIAEAYGSVVEHEDLAGAPVDAVEIANHSVLFDFLPATIQLRRERSDRIVQVPSCFEITARSERCPAYAVEHRSKELYAVHFSLASAGDAGKTIVKNFLRYAGTSAGAL
jgi:GMP synthase-like glutamine amidotransferase